MTVKLPIFVGGTARSGTTLLTELLGNHSMISPVYETHFVPELLKLNDIKDDLNAFQKQKRHCEKLINKWIKKLPIIPTDHNTRKNNRHRANIDKEFAMLQKRLLKDNLYFGHDNSKLIKEFTNNLFEKHTENENKLFWVNKTPANIDYIFELYQLFPNMKFIQIVRNMEDVVNSNLKQKWNVLTKEEIEKKWEDDILMTSRFIDKHAHKINVISYENLINHPISTLSYIFDWLLLYSSKETNKKEAKRIVKLFNIGEKQK